MNKPISNFRIFCLINVNVVIYKICYIKFIKELILYYINIISYFKNF